MEWIKRPAWEQRATAHQERLRPQVEPHLERRRLGTGHPVHDFLFSYYSFRPAQLLQWHPGYGVVLADAGSYLSLKGYAAASVESSATVPRAYVDTQRAVVSSIRKLLAATAGRPAQLGCFGLHEWAMVYRLDQADVRHAAWPLRLGTVGTGDVVESHRIACSHFDAFRFFTDAARARNTLQPGRDDRVEFEQPGCLHAGMDLYKHAFRLSPMICSDLVADCFELARDIRVLDMRASPYDLSDLGYEPVRIETTAGKQEYAAAQRTFADRGAPLRHRLIDACDRLLTAGG